MCGIDSDIDASAVIRRIHRPKSITSRKIRLSAACFVRFRLFAQRFRRVIDPQGERVVTVDSWVLSSSIDLDYIEVFRTSLS